jgi:hypothetical protein
VIDLTRLLLWLVLALAPSTNPSGKLTPGTLCTVHDPDFDGYRYVEHIPHCRRNLTESAKAAVARAYGIPRKDWGLYEFDHRIPLALGGSNSVLNIWPEPKAHAAKKDRLEEQLYQGLVRGTITQKAAIKKMLGMK